MPKNAWGEKTKWDYIKEVDHENVDEICENIKNCVVDLREGPYESHILFILCGQELGMSLEENIKTLSMLLKYGFDKFNDDDWFIEIYNNAYKDFASLLIGKKKKEKESILKSIIACRFIAKNMSEVSVLEYIDACELPFEYGDGSMGFEITDGKEKLQGLFEAKSHGVIDHETVKFINLFCNSMLASNKCKLEDIEECLNNCNARYYKSDVK